jgi:lambda family phage portal protein
LNWLDKAVASIAPVTALRRQTARRMLERKPPSRPVRFAGRDDRPFHVNTGDPNDARPRRYVDRQTILKLVAENPYARKAMSALINSLVGWGITGAPQGAKNVQKAWSEWIKVCNYNGPLDFYGMQELIARSMLRDGEVFVVPRLVSGASGIPLRLQMFDKGMLATGKVGAAIERGIEYDGEGRPVAYYFYRGRQGTAWSSTDTIRFPADEVIHLYHQEWIGQTEGVSIFDSVVKRLGDVEEGIEAEVVKANIAACLVGFRYRPPTQDGDDPSIGMPVDPGDHERPPVEEFVPGMINTLDPGEQIAFSSPPKTGGIGDLARVALLAASAGVGVTYEQMTGDLSNVNFSSYKAGALEFKRSIGRIQYLTFIPVFLDRVWAWFLKVGIDFGLFANRPVAMKWTPPPFESIDRKGDAEADILEMQAGLEIRPNLLAGRGYDHDEMMEATAKSQAFLKTLGLAFRGDPFTPLQTATTDPSASTDAAAARLLIGLLMRAAEGERHAS